MAAVPSRAAAAPISLSAPAPSRQTKGSKRMAAPQPSGTDPAPSPAPARSLLWPAAAVGLGFLLVYNSLDASAGVPPPAAAVSAPTTGASASASARPAPSPSAAAVNPGLSRSEPSRISIRSIAVNAPFTPLSIGASGQLDAPPADDANLVGWFKDGATPGERGTSVVAGHVDTKTGPAVFLLLSTLKAGNTVDITRKDGVVATFKVDAVETFSKADFPSDRVYSDNGTAQLRLITCGGVYDKKAKDYEDNVVVFAHLDSAKNG
ncbi:LPXTG-site transpeptidase (sortase) family protein [Streptomyces sp. DvalAA-21]|nr:peptidase C60 sortase A and B [Streptomyces sp. SirexAA-E]PZX42836.1 LPXTG-site transpeptidase (sortase) family protein [Streptomyces sp. DvalAA-21]RAJ39133.1 LPXTG-site transpeptidase (sortase) family protein [Streptomyces sp. DpondAA-E10]RAJ53094.1 LPXTG-site transpeptidase (sortase) family protein [Streptomyces sp. DpondAA-A50]SCE11839.1 LPXTG-site transpeptidase (sortase) family protein [Streptomyces sp. BpilaLS-43]SCM13870.1 LPXTG-site transpeptidase (sortase) family protein [Streptomy